ncbi:hypothetical protein DN730_00100 [Marinomonas piezotolerans]|uniref:Uncharacterized protein n=1 Tax=Marinomonas piezotolerans TaxID=2213058 RepID=A0A370UCN3_9GAMM|nr:WYL domain-containing protein [Marinomonas piezotolerans]RDL45491.1 hypothetical protein DN730_00100 [Marinomonas piezotolerans]
MDSIIRYISILELIPIGRKNAVSTTAIHGALVKKGFSISSRNLQRDLTNLSVYYPIECNDKSRPYLWSFVSDYKGSFAAMDPATAVNAILAHEYLAGVVPAPLLSQLTPQLNRARDFIQSHSDGVYLNWLDKVAVVPEGKVLRPAAIDPDFWKSVCEAIMSNKALDVVYESHSKDKSQEFVLHPYGVMVRKSATYILGSYNNYDDVRQFALHRFTSLKISSESFRPRSEFTIQKYIDAGEPGVKYSDEPIQLEALISKDLAKRLSETKLSDSQIILETDDEKWRLLRAVIPDDRDTRSWLLSRGAELIVREPISLKSSLLEEVASIKELSDSLGGLKAKME